MSFPQTFIRGSRYFWAVLTTWKIANHFSSNRDAQSVVGHLLSVDRYEFLLFVDNSPSCSVQIGTIKLRKIGLRVVFCLFHHI